MTSEKSVVTLIDLNKLVDPHDHYQPVNAEVDGRSTDGIHFANVGDDRLLPDTLPALAEVGVARPVS